MKLSFWTLAAPDWSNAQVVDAAKRHGYAGVDLRCAAGRNVSVESNEEELRQLRSLFDDAGIEIASLLAYNQRGNAEGVDWDAVTADLIAHAHLAQRLGVANLRINAAEPASGSSWDAYLEGFAGALTRTLAECDGVVMNMQNHPGSLSAAQVGRLAQLVGSERFGAGFSPDHCIDMGEDPLAAAEAVAPYVRQLHLADRERRDGKLRACLPGEGFVPNDAVMVVLARHGFEGWTSFKWEIPTYPDLPPADIALPHFVRFMAKAAP